MEQAYPVIPEEVTTPVTTTDQKPTTIKEAAVLLIIDLLDFVRRLTSRRFLGAVTAAVLPVLNQTQHWGIDPGVLVLITGSILTYIVADTYEQTQK